jgi:hypothetical protein
VRFSHTVAGAGASRAGLDGAYVEAHRITRSVMVDVAKLDEVPGFLGTRRPRLGGSRWPSISPQAVVQLHDQYGPPVASRPTVPAVM